MKCVITCRRLVYFGLLCRLVVSFDSCYSTSSLQRFAHVNINSGVKDYALHTGAVSHLPGSLVHYDCSRVRTRTITDWFPEEVGEEIVSSTAEKLFIVFFLISLIDDIGAILALMAVGSCRLTDNAIVLSLLGSERIAALKPMCNAIPTEEIFGFLHAF